MTVLRNSLARCNARHLRIKRLVQFIFADPIYHNALTNCAALSCRALRRVARMCSRTVSGTAYRFRHGSTLCSPTVEKILCRSLIVSALQISPYPLREKGGFTRGWKTAGCLSSCAPARRQRNVRGETAAVPFASQAKLPPVCTGKSNLNYRESRRFLNPVRHCKTETFI